MPALSVEIDGNGLTQKSAVSALVTGAGGFVGSHLVEHLVSRGWQVRGVGRNPPAVPVRDVHYDCHSLGVDPKAWQKSLAGVHCVVHLAAYVHQMRRHPGAASQYEAINVQGSRFVAEQAARAGARKFLLMSSVKVNGEGGRDVIYGSEDVPNPQDDYGRSKWQAETAVREICGAAGMEFIIVRSPLIYGSGVRANFHRIMQLAAAGVPLPFGAVQNRRSLVGVWNLVDFMEHSLRHAAAPSRVWMISDGDDLSTPQLLASLAGAMGRRMRLFRMPPSWLMCGATLSGLAGEMRRLCGSLRVDATPAREHLQWRAPMSVDAGLALTAQAFMKARAP